MTIEFFFFGIFAALDERHYTVSTLYVIRYCLAIRIAQNAIINTFYELRSFRNLCSVPIMGAMYMIFFGVELD